MSNILSEIITIGDEILYGQIVDTNSQWISAELDKEGIKASIVIGKDSMDNVLDYSKRFNQKVLIDSSGRYFNEIGAKGVPYFAVTNQSGKRLEEMSGGYREVRHMREQLGI